MVWTVAWPLVWILVLTIVWILAWTFVWTPSWTLDIAATCPTAADDKLHINMPYQVYKCSYEHLFYHLWTFLFIYTKSKEILFLGMSELRRRFLPRIPPLSVQSVMACLSPRWSLSCPTFGSLSFPHIHEKCPRCLPSFCYCWFDSTINPFITLCPSFPLPPTLVLILEKHLSGCWILRLCIFKHLKGFEMVSQVSRIFLGGNILYSKVQCRCVVCPYSIKIIYLKKYFASPPLN